MLDFLAYLEFERGLSRNTLEAYRSDLLQFGRFLDEHEHNRRRRHGPADRRLPGRAGRREGRRRVAGHDPSQGGMPALLLPPPRREGILETDPTASVTAPRRGRKLPQVLTRGQVNKLLAQPKGTEPTDLRDRALLELMYACGLRASEAIGLEVADVDLDDGFLRARGKGSKERVVPVGQLGPGGGGALPGARAPGAGGHSVTEKRAVRELPGRRR